MLHGQPARIAVVRLPRFGDILLVTPLIRALRRVYPNSEIDAIVSSGYEPVLANNPDATRVGSPVA